MKALLKWLISIAVVFVASLTYKAIVEGGAASAFKLRIWQFTQPNAEYSFGRLKKNLSDFREVVETLAVNSNSADGHRFRYLRSVSARGANFDVDTLIIKIPSTTLLKYDCLTFELNNIGIPNSLVMVEGFMHSAIEEIARLRLENARLRKRPVERIRELKILHKKTKEELDLFLKTESWSD